MTTYHKDEYQAWLRFAGSRAYHRTAPDYIRQGLSLCGRDLSRTGFELMAGDETEPVDRRHKRCARCLKALSRIKE